MRIERIHRLMTGALVAAMWILSAADASSSSPSFPNSASSAPAVAYPQLLTANDVVSPHGANSAPFL